MSPGSKPDRPPTLNPRYDEFGEDDLPPLELEDSQEIKRRIFPDHVVKVQRAAQPKTGTET